MKQFFTVILYQPLYNLLIFLAWLIPGHSIGWAIIILTIIIRLALLPSAIKAAHFQAKNNKLQPQITKIKKEIKDTQEQSKAIMELYKSEGHSPFGSCLQSLVQLPVLIVLYQVFRNGLTTKGFSSLYHFTLHPAVINTNFFGFNIMNPDHWVLPIVAALLQTGLSFLMLPKKVQGQADDPSAMMSKQMLFMAPLITILFGRSLPAALVLYWITTTLFSLVLQYFVNKSIYSKPTESFEVMSSPVPTPIIEKPKSDKKNVLLNVMSKRLDKQEKKAGVNVTVRAKKKW